MDELMSKSLFIVRSPLQFLNAIEARERFKCDETVLVLMFNKNPKNNEQMRSLLITDDWCKTIEYDQQKFSRLQRFSAQANLVKSLKSNAYDYIFSGDFGTINQIILANVEADKIYLVDDGIATIAIHKKVSNKNYFRQQNLSRRMKFYRYCLFGLAYRIKQPINFYTIYDIKSTDTLEVIHHEFDHLKASMLQQCELEDVTYLLGQNMIETGLMSAEIYLSYVKKIIAHYPGKIIYIPHRTEVGIDTLEKLENDFFIVRKSVGAIELVLLDSGIYPAHIISFFSSALFNLDKIFNNSIIDAIFIDPKDIKKFKKEIEASYQFFENTTVNTVTL